MQHPTRNRSILVATDLRDDTVESLHSAISIARAIGAGLHVVHAHDVPFPRSDRGRNFVATQTDLRDKRRLLNELVGRVVPTDVPVESARVHEGPAAEVILEEARAVGADVIVLGPHRNRGVADRLVGSTAERVLREADVPCLLANAPLRFPIRKILVPTDRSNEAERAFGAALDWAGRLSDASATISLVHVLAPMKGTERPWAAEEIESDLRRAARTAVAEDGARYATEVAVLKESDAALALVNHAHDSGTQLIVMGTKSDPVLLRAIVGSVSSAMIRRADVPIMIVPSGVRAEAGPPELAVRG